MSTTVRQLIEKLQKYDPDLVVIIEPSLDHMDAEGDRPSDVPLAAVKGTSEDILLREASAQYDEVEGDAAFDVWDASENDKKVLIISSRDLKYGRGE